MPLIEFEFDRLLQAIERNTAGIESLLRAASSGALPQVSLPAPTTSGASSHSASTLPFVMGLPGLLPVDIMRAMVSSGSPGTGVPKISGLPITVAAGSNFTYTSAVPAGEVWWSLAHERITSTLQDTGLLASIAVDEPSNLIISSVPIMDNLTLAIAEFTPIRSNLQLTITNGAAADAIVTLYTQYATPKQAINARVVEPLLEMVWKLYQAAAAAGKGMGLP